jgi:Domain of unknown function (DUF4338)
VAPEPLSPREHDVHLRYRNREVTTADIEWVRRQCVSAATRGELARAVCAAWQWKQANGAWSLHACADLLLRLEARGLVKLPPSSRPLVGARRRLANLPLPPDLIALTGREVCDPDADLGTLWFGQSPARSASAGGCTWAAITTWATARSSASTLLYAAFVDDELVALLGWASAALRAPAREKYVGWDEATKLRRLHLVTNNIRFLILPWVRVRHLASKILAANVRRLSADWEAVWKHPVVLAETFVDLARFRGTCYRAANWLYLGETAGRRKRGNNYLHGGTKKALLVYPLRRHATRYLRETA